jgi:hypothetical protein
MLSPVKVVNQRRQVGERAIYKLNKQSVIKDKKNQIGQKKHWARAPFEESRRVGVLRIETLGKKK